ncbi:MAG: DUF3606 domain-containing protein [Bacteroidota bacterium]
MEEALNPPTPQFDLNISLADTFAFATRIWIFNRKKRMIAGPDQQSRQFRHYRLPAGNYIIRFDINGQIQDNDITLDADKNYSVGLKDGEQLQPPKLYSAALIKGIANYESSHEYYTEPAIGISKLETFKDVRLRHKNSGIFIFLRFPDQQAFETGFKKQAYWEKFSLTTERGRVIASFPRGCVGDDNPFPFNYQPGSGYIGLSGYLNPGLYFLNYSGTDERVIPIYVYDSWYTQLFMTVGAEPLFGSVRIFISKHREFDPSDRNNLYIDYCLSKIQNNDLTLDNELLENIAYQKYQSPMLGLLGAYIYLSSTETKNDELFRTIVRNLQREILKNSRSSPDIWALNLLSYDHFQKTLTEKQQTGIKGTPMLRIAFDTIRRAAFKYPWLVPENSINDHIAENQVFDSPYNTFRPFKPKYEFVWTGAITTPSPVKTVLDNRKGKRAKPGTGLDILQNLSDKITVGVGDEALRSLFDNGQQPRDNRSLQRNLDRVMSSGSGREGSQPEYEPIKYYGSFAEQVKLNRVIDEPGKTSQLGSFIAAAILDGNNLTPSEIAERMNLPLNTVLRIFKELHIETSDIASKNTRKQINIDEDYEVRAWSGKFGVTPDELKAAVKKAGKTEKAVIGYLNKSLK